MDDGYFQGRRNLKFALFAMERGYLYPPRLETTYRQRPTNIVGFDMER